MKTTFRMLPASDKDQAINSIIDVLYENPLWTNKCTSDLFAVIKSLTVTDAETLLKRMPFAQVQNLYVEIRTQYYKFEEITKWK